jgi:hypothetical protein
MDNVTQVGGYSVSVTVTPTISGANYASGNQIGGVQTLTNACQTINKVSTLMSVVVIDKVSQNAGMTIFFFTALPTLVSSNNTAFNVADSEMVLKSCGSVSITSADYVSTAVNSVATLKLPDCALAARSADPQGALYAVAMADDSPTYTASTDLTFKYVFGQDL